MKSKLPFIVVLGIASLVFLSIYRYFEYRAQLSDDFEQFQLYREEKMLSYSDIGAALIRDSKLTELKNLMESARKARDIDFYILQYKSAPLLLGAYGEHPEEIDIDYKFNNQLLRGLKTSTYTTFVDADSKFTIGLNRSFENHFQIKLSQQKISEIQVVIGPIILFLFLAAYFFKDIKKIIVQLRSIGKRDFRQKNVKSLEAEILLGGLSGFNDNIALLGQKVQTLENQVLPSMRSEILSGLQPPYSFDCTLVRTDINNFSVIFNRFDTEKLMAVINDFFTEVSHIVARYDGFIHDFIGDEVIFYIKNQENENSTLKALSTIRDINESAQRFNDFTKEKLGYSFTVKSSLARGRLRFGHLVDGFTLAGAVLIESVRVLSHIVEKEENLVCFNRNYDSELRSICELIPYGRVHLKGYTEEIDLIRYLHHRPISLLLQKPSPQSIALISYYRSNKDVAEILFTLRQQRQQYSVKVILDIIKILRQLSLTQYQSTFVKIPPSQVALELVCLLEDLALDESAERPHVLSAVCNLMKNLMTTQEFEFYFDPRIIQFLEHQDHRVVANIIDVIAYFRKTQSHIIVRPFLDHKNGRIAANALVYEGSREISSEIIRRLNKALSAEHPHIVAGGLYALGEIARHHRLADPVYYNSQVEFLNLVNSISRFFNSPEPTIARQSLLAAQKIKNR